MIFLWTTVLVLGTACAHKVVVSDTADAGFADFKSEKIRFAIYKITDKNLVVEEFRGPRSSTYADFITHLRKTNPDESRYGIFDFDYVKNGKPEKKLVTFLWSPETAPKEEVLLYALEDKIELADHYDVKYYLVAKTDADLDEKTVESRIKKFSDLAGQVAKEEGKEAGGNQ